MRAGNKNTVAVMVREHNSLNGFGLVIVEFLLVVVAALFICTSGILHGRALLTAAGADSSNASPRTCLDYVPARNSTPQPPPGGSKALEQYAFSAGLQAYLYGYPLVITEVSREEMLINPADKENRFYHFSQLFTPAAKMAVSANVDTLMSTAWLDFSGGPMVLHVPDMHGRYWVIQFNDFYTNSFAYVGLRTTGSAQQQYLVVGPRWAGSVPEGMRVIHCPTNVVFLVGRIFVGGERDLPNAQALQRGMSLTPFDGTETGARRETNTSLLPESLRAEFGARLTPPAIVARMDAVTFFSVMTRLMQLYPPPRRDEAIVKQFQRIGIDLDHGFNTDRLDRATLDGLARAADAAIPFLNAAQSRLGGTEANGWWTPPRGGAFGTDYVLRAYMALNFIWPNVPEEAVYPMASVDENGRPLDGAHRYLLHFAKEQTPPVDAFWSVTMFNTKRALVENPIHRYAVGSRTEGLKYNPDGSLVLYLQAEAPIGHKSNWLPSPKGPFLLIMRLYLPKPEILNGEYKIPPVSCTDCSMPGSNHRAR
jgi:hypothetical protein